MNRCKPNQYIFSLFILFGALSPSWADWQARFSTLMEALLYPITRRLPQNVAINETVPESPEDVLHRLRSIVQFEKQEGQLNAEKFVALLEDGAIKTGLNLMEVYEELRHEYLPESSVALLEETLNLLPVNNPFSYLIAADLWQHWQSQAFPQIQNQWFDTILNPSETCRSIPHCMLANARILMREGRFHEASEAYKIAYTDPDSEFEYLNCDLMVSVESQNIDETNKKLSKLKSLFSHMDLHAQEKNVAFTFLDFDTIAQLILSGYIPEKHEFMTALVALYWKEETEAAQRFVETHELTARIPSESIFSEFPNAAKALLLSNLEASLQIVAVARLELTTSDLELLKKYIPEENPLYSHLFMVPVELDLPPLESPQDLSKLFDEIKSSQHAIENLPSAFVEHPRMKPQKALRLALEAIGNELPNSLELKARILMRLEAVDMESYLSHSGLNAEDTAKGKSLLLAALGRNTQALEELKKVPGHKNSAQYHLLELQFLKNNSDEDTIYRKVESVLERWPEFSSNPLVIDVLFQQGLFDDICNTTIEIHSDSHVWDQYVLAHIFTGRFKKAVNLFDIKPTDMVLPTLPEPHDISGFYHTSLSLYNMLPNLAKNRQLQRFRQDLSPKIAFDIMPESQGFPQEIQTLLKELAAQYKTE